MANAGSPLRHGVLLFLAVGLGACGGSTPITPTPPSPISQSGKLDDLQAAQDIIDWNMHADGGASYRQRDRICRWELPMPVYIADSADRPRVIAALDYWASQTGLTYRLLDADALPRVLVRFGMDGLPSWGGARALIDGTNANNSARSGLIVYEPSGGSYCAAGAAQTSCVNLYRHELGHTWGIFTNTAAGGMMGSLLGDISDREKRMLKALYSLPHGAAVEADGTWKVVGQ